MSDIDIITAALCNMAGQLRYGHELYCSDTPTKEEVEKLYKCLKSGEIFLTWKRESEYDKQRNS